MRAIMDGIAGDHPRVCGEQPNISPASRSHLGSPPRVRGTVLPGRCPLRRHRITPACAGNRLTYIGRLTAPKDHPRVCGEQCMVGRGAGKDGGSPPRVRGTESMPRRRLSTLGITPACAGNRPGRSPAARRRWDHPRVCGEQRKYTLNFLCEPGSPPRVRGTASIQS